MGDGERELTDYVLNSKPKAHSPGFMFGLNPSDSEPLCGLAPSSVHLLLTIFARVHSPVVTPLTQHQDMLRAAQREWKVVAFHTTIRDGAMHVQFYQ